MEKKRSSSIPIVKMSSKKGEATQKFILSRCKQQRQKKNKSGIRKGKRVVKMDVDQDEAMEIHIQEEIIMEILSRLPVRSLLRFKCASKCWNTLISNPYFKMKHLNLAVNNNNSHKLVACHSGDDAMSFSCISLSSGDVQQLDFPLHFNIGCFTMFCSSYGLCVIGIWFSFRDKVMELVLWNPSTRESILLPLPEYINRSCTLGLGYDSTIAGYKIIMIYKDEPYCPRILALNGGSWRNIDGYPHGIRTVLSGMDNLALVHGAFHWIGFSRNYFAISFSISNEMFGEIPLPEKMKFNSSYNFVRHGISVLGGMFCAYTTFKEGPTFKLWVMKDYGVQESWTELFTLCYADIWLCVPRYRFADGEVLLYCKYANCLGSGFLTSKGPFGLWPLYDDFQQGVVFTESLISPKLLSISTV